MYCTDGHEELVADLLSNSALLLLVGADEHAKYWCGNAR